ncbi:MAG: tungsten cofactor oxidoreductase radical SAM maturase [Bacillota bacterium]|nr:tungsten cofactor oxidoreductase radical SAM maturase [Bacillota bacterium]
MSECARKEGKFTDLDNCLVVKKRGITQLIPRRLDVKKLYLEVTNKCNLDCITCIRNSWKSNQGYMEESTFQQLLEQLDHLPELQAVHLGGFGEPLSHPKILEYIKALKEKGLRVEMISNGFLLNEQVARRLVQLRLDKLAISLDSPEEASFNDIRLGGEFNQVVENISRLNSLKQELGWMKLELGIEFVAMKRNQHQLPELLKLADNLRAGFVIVTNLLPYSQDMVDQVLYDAEDEELMVGTGAGYLLFRGRVPEMKLRSQRKCSFVEDKAMVITWEGNVSPCYAGMHHYYCYTYGRKKEMFPYHFGNLTITQLKDIWINEDFLRFRQQVLEFDFPSCTDCKYLEGCSMVDDNKLDCWGNSPTCADCLWARGLILCP